MAFMFLNNRKRKFYSDRRLDTGDGDSFKSLYRFTYENVQWLTDQFLGAEDYEKRGGAVSKIQKMKTFLRCVGDPGFQIGIANDLGIHRTTISKIIWEVCLAICSKAHLWIKFPTTPEQFNEAKSEWQAKYQFPCTIGVLDCTHVTIQKPSIHGDEYLNRKGNFSINVQATGNAKEWFTSIDAQWPGSVHDSRIWRLSRICSLINENEAGAVLLADEGYGLTPWIITPFRNPQTDMEKKFNKLLTKERVLIERMFGQLKRRFPFLSSRVRLSTNRIPRMILACFVLHNIAKYLNDEDFPDTAGEAEMDDVPVPEHSNETNTTFKRGKARRNQIAAIIQGYNF